MKNKTIIFLTGLLLILACSKLDRIDPENFGTIVNADTILFAEIGDFGNAGMNEYNVAAMVKSWNPDFIISGGDNNYTNGKLVTIKNNISQFYGDYIYNYDAPEAYKCYGKAFNDKINRFFPTPGNHDAANWDKLMPYYNFFTLPGNESYYSFRWGPVSFFSINSVNGDQNKQKEWLKSETNLSNAPFKIVFFHHPPYSSGGHGNNDFMQWDFKSMGLDVVFTGHDHVYNRIEKVDEKGLYYIVNGLGGAAAYKCDEHPLAANLFNTVCYGEDYGAIKAVATKNKLVIEFYSIANTAQPIDKVVIEK